ncbi:unnamed protein product [Caenorhabditis angaria]|uniref:SXP/RAL-2 family protein Ani s 5-like cation-binding domain-containing protein n=1 Tax=Caenorhabditis angaria TaxID=860376 RepID=A0A9P1INI9_9PELO|nr:unnamed protein product [Caenorhabditis angaria]
MFSKLAVCVLLISTVYSAKQQNGQQGGPQGPPPPPFLQNVTDAARQAFFTIVSNENLTITEIDSQTATWASTYGVSDIYNEFQTNQTALETAIQKNITSVISNLSSVESSLETIFNNKDQTRSAINASISTLIQSNPIEVQVLLQLRNPMPPQGGPQGGFGGQQGGNLHRQ